MRVTKEGRKEGKGILLVGLDMDMDMDMGAFLFSFSF